MDQLLSALINKLAQGFLQIILNDQKHILFNDMFNVYTRAHKSELKFYGKEKTSQSIYPEHPKIQIQGNRKKNNYQ